MSTGKLTFWTQSHGGLEDDFPFQGWFLGQVDCPLVLSLILISINRLGHAFLGRSCPRKIFAAEKLRKAQTQLGSDPSWRLEQAQNVAIKHPKPPGFNNLRKLLGVLLFLVSSQQKSHWSLESFWGLRSVRFYLKGQQKKESLLPSVMFPKWLHHVITPRPTCDMQKFTQSPHCHRVHDVSLLLFAGAQPQHESSTNSPIWVGFTMQGYVVSTVI